MKIARLAIPAAALIALSIAACGDDPTEADGLFDDSAVTLDVAASAGDAVASMIETMSANEIAASGSAELALSAPAAATDLAVSRSRSCFDAAGVAVTNCQPFASVRMIVTTAVISGSRSSSRTNTSGTTVTWTGAVHRTSNDTTRRIFTGTTETSRVHNDVGAAHDTTTFTDGSITRLVAETAKDTVKSITFNLPRSTNPYPVSGSVVRAAAVHVEVTKDGKTVKRDVSRTAEVLFPADAQGNVVLKINAKTCNLNLVTHAVTNCQ